MLLAQFRRAARARVAARWPAAPTLVRCLSNPTTSPLSAAELVRSSRDLNESLRSQVVVSQLQAVRASADSLTKWMTCNMAFAQQASGVVQRLPGLGAGSEARYLELLLGAGADEETAEKLRELGRERWEGLLENAFGCGLGPQLDLPGARALAIGMVDALQSPDFMRKVSDLMRGDLMAQLSAQEKQQAVARLIVIKQKEAIVPYGYSSSDEGYAQAQAALQEFALDAVIQGSIQHVTQKIYVTAGIDLAELMQQMQSAASQLHAGGRGPG